jgi:hypothetical protein
MDLRRLINGIFYGNKRQQDGVSVANDAYKYWQCPHDLWLFSPLPAGWCLRTRHGHGAPGEAVEPESPAHDCPPSTQ